MTKMTSKEAGVYAEGFRDGIEWARKNMFLAEGEAK